MTAAILDGDRLAAQWRLDIAAQVAALRMRGVAPAMATILVGDDPASLSYIGRKHADCVETGIVSRDLRLAADVSEAELLDAVRTLNNDPTVHGIIVQLPLPPHIDPHAVIAAVDPAKDIDGLHPMNLGLLVAGQPALRPCTPAAIIGLLEAYGVPLAGRRVAIVGRGPLVGRPLSLMMSDKPYDAEVTLLHRASRDLGAVLRNAEVIVAAAGSPRLITADMVSPGAAVVGVGITYENGVMVSDIDEAVAETAAYLTPRHGSVGALTRAMLLKNLLQAAGAA